MTSTTQPVSKTRSFSTVFLIEMWERFGFYGMQALIVYYMVLRLGFSDHHANLVWGACAALIYAAPAAGGWIGDKILGTRHTMTIGAITLALGYALMAIPTVHTTFLYLALGVVVVGNGMFKSNAGNMVRKIYEGDDSQIDSAFTIYYMAVNIGSMISIFLSPLIKNYVNAHWGHGLGWHAAFGASCVGLLIGLTNYLAMRHTLKHIGSEPDHQPIHYGKLLGVLGIALAGVFVAAFILNNETVARLFIYAAGAAVLGIFIYLISNSRHGERAGLIAALVLTVETVFFFIFYQQMPTSLNLFALRNVDPSFNIFGWHLFTLAPAQFQTLNPIWIIILSPLLAWIYNSARRSGKDFSIATKFALGFVAVSVGFFIYANAAHFTTEPGKATPWVMVWGYAFTSLGELLVSGLGLAMIARYVPGRMGGFMMGAYFVASGISQYLGTWVATIAGIPEKLKDVFSGTSGGALATVRDKYPQILDMSLKDFNNWMQGKDQGGVIADKANLPAFSELPGKSQQLLQQFNDQLLHTTMPIYTTLFFWLGIAGIVCTIIALAVLPMMRKLGAQHDAHQQAEESGMPTIGSEE